MSTVQELVARGAAWLDGQPEAEGWDRRIDLETVDVSGPYTCVVAQAFEGKGNLCCPFHYGAQILHRENPGLGIRNFGFAAVPMYEISAEQLRQEWVRVILGRREASVVTS